MCSQNLLTKVRTLAQSQYAVNSAKNIQAHYDLSNELYDTFLDQRMLYPSGIYRTGQDTLEQAQINKMERLCQQLNLSENDSVIEIGTGWGAMAIYMAEQYGCHVTTTTISQQQYLYAKQEIEKRVRRQDHLIAERLSFALKASLTS